MSYTSLTSDSDVKAKGLRYYDSSLYLLAQKDANGTWQTQFLYLPDQTKEFQAVPCNFLAVNTTSFTFTNAILTDASSDADASAVPAAIIKALQTAASAMIKSVQPEIEEPGTPPPAVQLFKVVKVKGQWGVIGASAPEAAVESPAPQ